MPRRLPASTINAFLLVALCILSGLIITAMMLWIPQQPMAKAPVYGIAVYASVVSLLLIAALEMGWLEDPDRGTVPLLILIVLFGMLIRLFLALNPHFNFDIISFSMAADILERGGNIYAETVRYNYAPVWFGILGLLSKLPFVKPSLWAFACAVRIFVSYLDLFTLLVLLGISRIEKLPVVRIAALFYLNPISFLLSGYHGQFENFAVLLLLVGIFGYIRWDCKTPFNKGWLWCLSTLALIVKHNIFYQAIITVNYMVKRWWLRFLLLGVSALLFVATFIPFASSPVARDNILNNVFLYSSFQGRYGITLLYNAGFIKYLFILGLVAYPFSLKSDDLIQRCLQGMLFFVAFTTGISAQYIVLPVALGSLRPSRGMLAYTAVGSLFLLGRPENVGAPFLTPVSSNVIWIVAVYWFLTTHFDLSIALKSSVPKGWPHLPGIPLHCTAQMAVLFLLTTGLVIGSTSLLVALMPEERLDPMGIIEQPLIVPLLGPEMEPLLTIPNDAGVTPCGVFDVGGHGLREVRLNDFPHCTGNEFIVLCLDNMGQWTSQNVSDVEVSAWQSLVRFTSHQHGTCGVFKQ